MKFIFGDMKRVVVILFLLGGLAAVAQPYQSLFGKDSTRQNIVWLGIDFVHSDSIHVEKDTMVNGYAWKKLKSRFLNFFKGGLIREDTVTGKVWYKSLGTGDTATVLAFDFSLVKGDTFDLRAHWVNYPVSQMIVDTTFIVNGRKVIEFRATVGMQFSEKIRFIEGVGGNLGLIYKDYHASVMMMYLLCAFKDGVQTYSNIFFSGQCWVVFTATQDQVQHPAFSIYPGLFSDQLIIDNHTNRRLKRVLLFNEAGAVVFSVPYNRILSLPQLPAGLYIIALYAEKGMVYSKKIMRR